MSSMYVVGADELTKDEKNSFRLALSRFRDAMPSQANICSEPMRDASGRFCEVRVYNKSEEPRKLLGVVPLGSNGVPERVKLS